MIRVITQFICRRVLWLAAAVTIVVPWSGWATATFTNTYGYYTGSNNLPIIDAKTWVNDALLDNIITTYPFDVTSVVVMTNRANMSGRVGFRFDTVDEVKGTRKPQQIFYNEATISAIDSPLQFFNPFFGDTFPGFGNTVAPASYVLINASNIFLPNGTLQVGNVGLMRLNGKNIDLTEGTLAAGDLQNLNTNIIVYPGNLFGFLNASVGRGLIAFNEYVNPPNVYDLYWAANPGLVAPAGLAAITAANELLPGPLDGVQFRGGNGAAIQLPLGTNVNRADFDFREFYYNFGTNYYVNIVEFRTNQPDPAVHLDVRFGFDPPADQLGFGTNFLGFTLDPSEALVQFSAVTNDVTTGLPVTNAFYLLDSGAWWNPITVYSNAADFNQVGRPNSFEVTTAMPFEWVDADTNLQPVLAFFYKPFDPNDLFDATGVTAQGQYAAKPVFVPYNSGSYGFQVGRNPESLNGLTITSNMSSFADLLTNFFTLPNPTNDVPRIEINATNLNLTAAYIRSEGMVNLNVKHLVPGTPAGIDAGVLNGDIASTNGQLSIAKVLTPTFKRVRGDVFAWSGNYEETATNSFATNLVHVHILIVDTALTANYTPTFNKLALRGTQTTISDSMRVISSSLFQAQQLTIDSKVTLAEGAKTLSVANLPNLQDMFITSNGLLHVENVAMIGFDRPNGINTFTNNGLFIAAGPLVKANVVENTGAIFATNGSAMVLTGDTMNLIPGPSFPGAPTNTLGASRNITLSGGDLTVFGSTITCGADGGPGYLTLDFGNSLSDYVPNIPGTNNVITNIWTTTAGIQALRNPFRGDIENDLYGTEVIVAVTNRTQARVAWPAQDVGADVTGFQNNLVIGHLVIDRQTSTSSVRFSATGGQSAVYVDYLELRDFAFSDYRNGLVVDPNMTVYFAASNFEPQKLMAVYPGRLVWVQGMLGPNSTKAVARKDGTVCLMNLSEANSQILDRDGDGTPNGSDPFPLDNDKTGEVVDCPGGEFSGSSRTLFTASLGKAVTSLSISTTGYGKVTPQPRSGLVDLGSSYTFNAVPKPGNLFAGWSGDINTTQPKVTFTLLSNMVLNARFVTNPFTGLKGSYNGLFYDTNGVNIDSAGAVALVVNQQGGFSGRLTTAGGAFAFGGQFDPDGNATTTVPRGKKARLGLTLKLDTAGAQQITGTLSESNWTAAVIADHAVFGGRNVAPFSGSYTFTWPGSDSDPANNPGGDSYGSAFINRAGQLIATIRLADNNTVQQVVPVSKDGNWPLFGALPGTEIIIGWVHIDHSSVLSSTIDWIKMPVKAGLYRNGFSNTVSLVGSAWVAPKTRGANGLNLTNPVITLANGNLGGDVVPAITFNPNNLTFSSSNPSLSLKLTPSVGVISGHFIDPATSRIRPFGGVMLQNQNEARGFFLGTDQSGAVRLDNP